MRTNKQWIALRRNAFARLIILWAWFIPLSLIGQSCVLAPSGLVAWWRGEGNGADETGGNIAMLLNGVDFAPSQVGQGFAFDGVDDRVIVSNAPSLNFGPDADFSIEAWIQPLPAVTDFGVQSIVDKRLTPDSTAAVGYAFVLADGNVTCQLADAPLTSFDFSTFTAAGPDLRDGQFHHVAMVVQRAAVDGGKLYVDGQVVLTFDPTVQPGDLSTTEPLRIGNHADPALNAQFKGRIDDVAIYSRALSSNEIAAIHSAGSAGKCGRQPSLSFRREPQPLDEEGFHLTLTGDSGRPYRIDVSTNLLDWAALATLTNMSGTTHITDPSATNSPLRFYRAAKAD